MQKKFIFPIFIVMRSLRLLPNGCPGDKSAKKAEKQGVGSNGRPVRGLSRRGMSDKPAASASSLQLNADWRREGPAGKMTIAKLVSLDVKSQARKGLIP